MTLLISVKLFNFFFNQLLKLTVTISDIFQYFNLFPSINLSFPFNIAIIPDGNRRFFKKHNKNFKDGYKNFSLKLLKKNIDYLFSCGSKSVTVFILSSKNLKRSNEEVKIYYNLIEQLSEKKTFNEYKIRIYGNLEVLPAEHRNILINMEKGTIGNKKELNLLIGYSNYEEIVEPKKFSKLSAEIEVDYFFRTGNTHRFSDFMLESISRGCVCEFLEFYWPQMTPLVFSVLIFRLKLEKKLFNFY